ncbi:MAG: hypothetical protein IT267_11370 [Saprospiraceae bacterium]|nr:hypothetical protein [Saprospiraceae bacterium]
MKDPNLQDSMIKTIIQTGYSLLREIATSLNVFLIVGMALISFFTFRKLTSPDRYIARTSFMLNEASGNGSGISAILGQFGIQTPGEGVSLQKVIEIAKTRIISENVFLEKKVVNGKEDLLGNHLINTFIISGDWTKFNLSYKENPLKNFKFIKTDLKSFSELENAALKKLHALFLKNLMTNFNERTGILELNLTLPDHDLSYVAGNVLFEKLSQFYIDKSIEKQQETYDKLKLKVDSIHRLMYKKDFNLANLKDGFRNTWTFQDVVPQTQTDRDIRMLNIIYTEALKNLEVASFTLQNQTPLIQALDLPIKPLESIKITWLETILKSFIWTIFLSIVFIMIRKILRDNS